MSRKPELILADIRAFEPTGGNWLPLDTLLTELWDSGVAGAHTADLLSLFERFSDEDGDVLWGLMHGLEGIPNFETVLVQSLQTTPSFMGALMVGRLLNGGVSQVDRMALVQLLQDVAASPRASDRVRFSAAKWAKRHTEPDTAVT